MSLTSHHVVGLQFYILAPKSMRLIGSLTLYIFIAHQFTTFIHTTHYMIQSRDDNNYINWPRRFYNMDLATPLDIVVCQLYVISCFFCIKILASNTSFVIIEGLPSYANHY